MAPQGLAVPCLHVLIKPHYCSRSLYLLLRLSLVLRSGSLQRRQPVLVPLADNPQRVLLFDLGHLVPVCDAAHGAIDVDDHGTEVVERDGRAAGAHVELRCVRGGFWEG